MNTAAHDTIYRQDYQPPAYLVDSVWLQFDLDADSTRVRSRLEVRRNPASSAPSGSWSLDGEQLELLAVRLDGVPLAASDLQCDAKALVLQGLPDAFSLEIDTRINPAANTELSGLYLSSGVFCTQCEAEGFRRITYFPDRPDVLARYRVVIRAERDMCPVLLSNGNPLSTREIDPRRIEAVWDDPHPKPSYLFALVAGNLDCRRDRFTTSEGRDVELAIYTRTEQVAQSAHAMHSLKASMRWDEERFGLSYDLDVFNIVAVDDFNMGAMENKGLNVFNTKYVLADSETATDTDFLGVEAVVAHEYFHNWTGNRITCRDWFQLSLKEGLTVFRDQEFSSDLNDRALKRIEDVRLLRSRQFPEDAGPMAHPIRPESYVEINNFYTLTVYEKGAEVVRMLHTLLGEDGFRRGMDLYIARHDGSAATCDDFRQAMADANGVDLAQFERWYEQAGTPILEVTEQYDADARQYSLTLRQSTPDTPGQTGKAPLVIPVRMGLLSEQGEHLALLDGSDAATPTERVLICRNAQQTFVFKDIASRPVLSLLRGFSAPVHVRHDQSVEHKAVLLRADSDAFNRWQAAQDLLADAVQASAQRIRHGEAPELPESLVDAVASVLGDESVAAALRAEALTVPDMETVAALDPVVDIDALDQSSRFVVKTLGQRLRGELEAMWSTLADEDDSLSPAAMGRRRLRSLCLHWQFAADHAATTDRVAGLYRNATNMTDRLAALKLVAHSRAPETDAVRCELLRDFEQRYRDEKLVIDKWFALQASSPRSAVFDDIATLLERDDFDIRNPNRARAVMGAFAFNNPVRFHAADGLGYGVLADFIAVYDSVNPQTSARLTSALAGWRRHTPPRQQHAKAALSRILEIESLSRDTWEIASKALDAR